MKTVNFLIISAVIFVVFLGGCSPQHNSLRITAKYKDFFDGTKQVDPNTPVLVTAEGEAAKPIATAIANNMKTPEARQTELVQSLKPLYMILFLVGLGGIALMLILKYMGMPSRFTIFIPIVAFGGMAIMHTFNQYAEWIPRVVIGAVLLYVGWKYVESKKERNTNYALYKAANGIAEAREKDNLN